MIEDNPESAWLSDILEVKIAALNYNEMRVDLWLAHDVEDVTFKAIEQLKAYGPDFSQIGPRKERATQTQE